MKKILFITNSRVDRNSGGVNRVTDTLANGFLQRGHKVCYYTFAATGEKEIVDGGVTQFYCEDSRNIASETNKAQLEDLIAKLGIDIIINQYGINKMVLDALASLDRKQAALLLVHHNCILCLYQNYKEIVSGNFSKRFWFKFINSDFFWDIAKRKYLKKLKIDLLNATLKSDRFVLISERFKEDIKNIGLPVSDNTVAISNPASFEIQLSALQKKENRILFVGSIKTPQKRVERLLPIWSALSLMHPDWYLDIVGDGPERKNLEDAFKTKNLERYTFHGNQDPKPFLEKAKFFLMTSDFEGFGMVLVESLAYGVVPVAFDSFTVLHDLIQNNINGIIVSAFDFDQYINRLSELMMDDVKRQEMAQNSQLSVQKFELNSILDQWEALFNDLKFRR